MVRDKDGNYMPDDLNVLFEGMKRTKENPGIEDICMEDPLIQEMRG